MPINEPASSYWAHTNAESLSDLENKSLAVPADEREAFMQSRKDKVTKRIFPFFDLPGKIRNQIYEELLVSKDKSAWHQDSEHCYPQMLAACKQAHDEASGYLHSVANADVRITIDTANLRSSSGAEHRHTDVNVWFNETVVYPPKNNTFSTTVTWPALLRQVTSVSLSIELNHKMVRYMQFHQSRTARQLNNAVYLLHKEFYEAGKLASLKLDLRTPFEDRALGYFEKPLSPLCALAGLVSLVDITPTPTAH